jgi:hypothetical protein
MVDAKQLAQVIWIVIFGVFPLIVGIEPYNYIKRNPAGLLPPPKKLKKPQPANTVMVGFGLVLAAALLFKAMQ